MTPADQLQRELDLAFRAVFGTDRERTKAQHIVCARLRQLAKVGRPLFSPLETDRVLAMREGRAEMWLEIENRCEIDPAPTIKDLLGDFADTRGENDDDN